jgi:hypothetical protein
VRNAIHIVFGGMTSEQMAELMSRGRFLYSEPDLRNAAINELVRSSEMMVEELAGRLGRSPQEFELRVFTGALIGAMLASIFPMLWDPEADFVDLIDRALAYLEKGMPL